MAEGGAGNPTRYEQEEETSYGPVNNRQAKEYLECLEKILDDFKDLLQEGREDTLKVMIQHMKRHMVKTWADMSVVDTNIILTSIHETSCITLCDSLEVEGVRASDPEVDIPTGLEVTRGLPQH